MYNLICGLIGYLNSSVRGGMLSRHHNMMVQNPGKPNSKLPLPSSHITQLWRCILKYLYNSLVIPLNISINGLKGLILPGLKKPRQHQQVKLPVGCRIIKEGSGYMIQGV